MLMPRLSPVPKSKLQHLTIPNVGQVASALAAGKGRAMSRPVRTESTT